jgi:hypothetical protein
MQDWKMIYSSSQLATASIVTSLLNENGIPAKALDKQDSSFVFMGKIEVLVPLAMYEKAVEILKTIELDTLKA